MYQINEGYRKMACVDHVLDIVKGFASWPLNEEQATQRGRSMYIDGLGRDTVHNAVNIGVSHG